MEMARKWLMLLVGWLIEYISVSGEWLLAAGIAYKQIDISTILKNITGQRCFIGVLTPTQLYIGNIE